MTSLPRRHVAATPRRWFQHARARANRVVGLIVVTIVFTGSGCVHPGAKQAAIDLPAVVVVENHTDYGWRIAFDSVTRSEAAEVPWQVVAPREIRRVELAGGTYRVWRTLGVHDTGSGPAAEAMELTFENGKTYAWPLGTLLSNERRDAP